MRLLQCMPVPYTRDQGTCLCLVMRNDDATKPLHQMGNISIILRR